MRFTVIIPARYGSTRLEGKPLLEINGLPMVQHVYWQASQSSAEAVYVATDDQRVFDAVMAFGGKVLMTRADHTSGTDRLQECAVQLGLDADHCIVNVQGDEPEIPPQAIDQVARLVIEGEAEMATLCEPVDSVTQLFDPNAVKLVRGGDYALYFSRAPIPWARDEFQQGQPEQLTGNVFYRHIGLYAYSALLLNRFVDWPEGQLEKTEKLEQLRVLENGCRIAVAEACEEIPPGIDTLADLEAARKRMASDDRASGKGASGDLASGEGS